MVSLKGTQIRDLAQLASGRNIDELSCRLWIYEACQRLSILYQTACIKTTKQITIEADVWTELDINDNRGVYRVEKDGVEYEPIMYKIMNEGDKVTVQFPEDGTFTFYALTSAPMMPDLNFAPQINSAYHQALAKFVAAQKRLNNDRSDPVGAILMSEFYQIANDADDMIKCMKKKYKRVPARLFR